MHLTACTHTQYNLINKHNGVTQVLNTYIKNYSLLEDIHTIVEKSYADLFGGGAGQKRMDIFLEYKKNGEPFKRYIDVSICDPAAIAPILKDSFKNPLIAAKLKEDYKINNFKRINNNPNEVKNFVPFVFESSGRPGKAVLKFLDELNLNDDNRRRLLQDISIIIANYGGKSIYENLKYHL